MTEKNKQKIAEALQRPVFSIQKIQECVQEVLVDEIAKAEFSDVKKQELVELCKLITLPIEMKQDSATSSRRNVKGLAFGNYDTTDLLPAVAGIAVYAFTHKFHPFWRTLLATTSAIGVDVVKECLRPNKKADNVLKIKTTAEDMVNAVDKLFTFFSSTEKSTGEKLDTSVLQWLQELYLESTDYTSEIKHDIQKRIGLILHRKGFELVSYDGTNDSAFEIQQENTIEKAKMIIPAIKSIITGNVICLGKVFVPYNK